MYRIVKRDGTVVSFQIQKIESVIEKAFVASGRLFDSSLIELLSLRVCADSEKKVQKNILPVEDIQDSVEKVLSECGFSDVAKAFILYRKQREKARNISSTLQDYQRIVESYVKDDGEVKAQDLSIGSLIMSNSGAITANYWLQEIYDKDISLAHRNGDIHIHGISMLAPYNAGWSMRRLIQEGIPAGSLNVAWPPVTKFYQLCIQLVNYLGILQNEWAGAQSICGFDTYASAYIYREDLTLKEVKEAIASMIFSFNMTSRWGSQIPFTQLTFDWKIPEELLKEKCWIANHQQNFTYEDCQEALSLLHRAFLEVMIEGDKQGKGFSHPILSYPSSLVIEDQSEEAKLLFQLSAKFGSIYFHYENPTYQYLTSHESIDVNTLYYKRGGYFGYWEELGCIGSVSINLPRLAYLADSEEEFFISLEEKMLLSYHALERKREILEKSLQNGFYPVTQNILSNFNYHFSTIGLLGMNEACLNAKWIATDLRKNEAIMFAQKTLRYMKEKCLLFQQQSGNLYSLEAIPAEKTCYRFAKLDIERYPQILTASDDIEKPYYTNSSQLPVNYEDDIFAALDLQSVLQREYTSGSVFHVFLEENLPDYLSCQTLVRKIHQHYRLPNLTISPTYSFCPQHGYQQKGPTSCPLCGKECEVYSRVSGYYRPVRNENEAKQKEFNDLHAFGTRSTLLKGKEVEKIIEKS